MNAEDARRQQHGERIWSEHESKIKAAQDRVTAAEQALDRARDAAWKAEDQVRGLFDDLNSLRKGQDFVQDTAGVAISVAGVVGSGGLGSFLILAGLGVANDLARPGALDERTLSASQGIFNDGVGELAAQQSGRLFETVGGGITGDAAGKIIGVGDIIKDGAEFLKPADLYDIKLSDFATSRDVQQVRDLFAKADPRGLAEKGFGPSKGEIDKRLEDWQSKLRDKERAEADLAQRRRELEQARDARHREYSACVHGGRC